MAKQFPGIEPAHRDFDGLPTGLLDKDIPAE